VPRPNALGRPTDARMDLYQAAPSSAWSGQRSLPRPLSLSPMLPGSMPYLESIPRVLGVGSVDLAE
jgi:hypothetical protein